MRGFWLRVALGVSCQAVRDDCLTPKIRRGRHGLSHERSLLGDLIYAKVAEIDEKCFDQMSGEHV